MNLADIKLFVLPINSPTPSELSSLVELKGTFAQRIAAAEAADAQSVLPLSAAEAAALAAHPEIFNLPVAVYLSHVPGASYDPMLDASIARLGMNVALWDAVRAELLAVRTEDQRRTDRSPWQHKGNAPDPTVLPAAPADDGSEAED